MPITSIDSYIVTGNEFDAHWTEVNADPAFNGYAFGAAALTSSNHGVCHWLCQCFQRCST